MTREPDPMRECRPGGSCPHCNPRPIYCRVCLVVEVESPDEVCEACRKEATEDRAADAAVSWWREHEEAR